MLRITTDRTRRFLLTAAFCAAAFIVGMYVAIYVARSPFGRLPAWEQVVFSLAGLFALYVLIDWSIKPAPEYVRKMVSGPVASAFGIAFIAFIAPWSHR